MFSFFSPEAVTYIDLYKGQLTFLGKKSRPAGKVSKVRLSVPNGAKPINLDLEISVIHSRPAPTGKGHVVVSQLLVAESQRQQVESLITSIPVPNDVGILARRGPRYPICLKGRSRELPGFAATTMDLSQFGARVAVREPVDVGTSVRLTLELDIRAADPQLTVAAKAVWCRRNVNGSGYALGLEFGDEQAANEQLQSYLKSLANRMQGTLQHRSIVDGEVDSQQVEKVSA